VKFPKLAVHMRTVVTVAPAASRGCATVGGKASQAGAWYLYDQGPIPIRSFDSKG